MASDLFRGSWLRLLAFVLAFAAPALASAQDAASAAKPLTVEDFVEPATWSKPVLSPSGAMVAIVRTENGVDALEVIDLQTRKGKILFRTRAPVKREQQQNLVQRISYLHWKTDSQIVVTVDTPASVGDFLVKEILEASLHILISPDGKTQTLLNEKNAGKASAQLILSDVIDVLPDDPDHLLMIYYSSNYAEADKVDVHTGAHTKLDGGRDVVGYQVDRKGNLVLRFVELSETAMIVQGRAPGETQWRKLFDVNKKTVKALEGFEVLDIGPPGVVYVAANPATPAEGDTRVARAFDLRTLQLGPVVWSNKSYDVETVDTDEDGKIIAGCYWKDALVCEYADRTLQANLTGISRYFQGERNVSVVSRARDNSVWIVSASGPNQAVKFFVFDAKAKTLESLGSSWPKLTSDNLGAMHRLDYSSRDGTPLFAYVTEPPGGAPKPAPLVVLPHGGPEARDKFEYDDLLQFLATRGYVVLQPTFRGSDGFGRKFAEAGYRQWGGRMHEDVSDAVQALIKTGAVDPKRVCIVGGSYGGYEALWAAHAEPDLYKCAVSFDGVADLKVVMAWERRHGETSTFRYWVKSIGDPVADAASLAQRSPVTYARSWTTPLLLIHGDKDDIVDVGQSRLMKRALEDAHKPVRYVEVKGMTHGPHSADEVRRVFGEIEAFLAAHIGPNAGSRAGTPKP